MSEVATYKDGEVEYIATKPNSAEVADADISRVIKKRVGYLGTKKDGTKYRIDKKKYLYTYKDIKKYLTMNMGGMTMTIRIARKNDDGQEFIQLVIHHEGKDITVRLTDSDAYDVSKTLQELFIDIPTYDDVSADSIKKLGTDVFVVLALLRSTNYIITKNDVISLGANENTTPKILKSLEDKRFLQRIGKVGRIFAYTCTIPRDKLERMFGRN